MNIQDKMQEIHHKFGVTEKANYEIQLFVEDLIKKDRAEQLILHGVSFSLPTDPLILAEYLHNSYELIAKKTNWNTQESCKVKFKDLPSENKTTMILLAGKLILDFVGNET
jgi:hypothetical protein